MNDFDLTKFWENDALAHENNCFADAPQVALGIRMSDECVFAELGVEGQPWGYTPREVRINLNKRYNDIAEKVVGKRVTSDVAKEVMTLMGHIVDCQNAIIHRCLKACEALRDQIDAKYAVLKEEKEQYNRHWGEETPKARDRFEAVPEKEEPDPALVAKKEALKAAVEEKRVPYEAARDLKSTISPR